MTAPTAADILAATPPHLRDDVARSLRMSRQQLAEWNNARLRTDLEASVRHEEDKE